MLAYIFGFTVAVPTFLFVEGLVNDTWSASSRSFSLSEFFSSATGILIVLLFALTLLPYFYHYLKTCYKLGTWIWF
jgi:hypothetical protein